MPSPLGTPSRRRADAVPEVQEPLLESPETPCERSPPTERGMTLETFYRRVPHRPVSGCWLWVGPKNWRGYGHAWDADVGRNRGTHRISFELHIGPIPPGMCVLHTCDVRHCVAPDHLWLGTHEDNVKDRDSKGRGSWGHSHKHLSLEQVQAIRAEYGGRNGLKLAEKYGIHSTTLYRIVKASHRRARALEPR